MIKTLTAYTYEIDDVEAALEEILEQLDLENRKMRNSVGILSCYSEFVESGVVKALCDRMDFDVVGCTTMGNATGNEAGTLMLSLSVLTSDTVQFSAAVSEPLKDDFHTPLEDTYKKALSQLPGEPVMMMTFAPLIRHMGGDEIVQKLDLISGGLPNFGTITVDHNTDYATAYTFYNGQASLDELAMILISGDLQPRFYIASISEERIQRQKAIITASQRNVLQEVNGIPILQYLKSLGLYEEEGLSTITIPFITDYNDGTKPVARAIYAISPEGYAVCGGDMPVDSTLSIGFIDHADVVGTSKKISKTIAQSGNYQGLFMCSCIARFVVMGADFMDEMEQVKSNVGETIPYHFLYSGGEICPVYTEEGKLVNRFHNDTLVACAF